MTLRHILIGGFTLVASFFIALFALDWLWPRSAPQPAPVLAQVPPLPPATRTSVVITPVAISLSAIRDVMETSAPRNLSGQRENPVSQLLSQADIGWTMARGSFALAGRPDGLTVSTPVSGALRITGQIGDQAGKLTGALAGLINQNLGNNVQGLTGKTLDQRADIRGTVAITSRPQLLPTWRLEPNLSAQVALGDGALSVAGLKLSVAKEMKPIVDRAVAEQVNDMQTRLRNDPLIEQTARHEWAKMCRAIPLGASMPGAPSLWLELRPVRAFAAQPRIDANNVTLTLGVQAESRIIPTETKPNCPFPAKLELVPPLDQGRVTIGVPIDMPMTEVNKLIEAQLKGKTFPDDGSGPMDVTVRSAHLSASGDRLLIALDVRAKEKKSWFGFGADATIHVWGKPVLDREQQMLRLTNISLAVESEAAFGLLGAAARSAVPYLEKALAERAAVDLKPFAASARKSIENAIAEFRKSEDGLRVDALVTQLRLADIAFDAKTLRVVAEADGQVRVVMTQLPH